MEEPVDKGEPEEEEEPAKEEEKEEEKPEPVESIGPYIPHTAEGRADCLACHGSRVLWPVPPSHAGRENSTCVACHQPLPGGPFICLLERVHSGGFELFQVTLERF